MQRKLPDKSQTVNAQGATTFGERVKSAREAAGLTREALEVKANLGGGSVSRIEREGQGSKRPGWPKIKAIAAACGCDAAWLASGVGSPTVPPSSALPPSGHIPHFEAAAASLVAEEEVSKETVEQARATAGQLGDLDFSTWVALLTGLERKRRKTDS